MYKMFSYSYNIRVRISYLFFEKKRENNKKYKKKNNIFGDLIFYLPHKY